MTWRNQALSSLPIASMYTPAERRRVRASCRAWQGRQQQRAAASATAGSPGSRLSSLKESVSQVKTLSASKEALRCGRTTRKVADRRGATHVARCCVIHACGFFRGVIRALQCPNAESVDTCCPKNTRQLRLGARWAPSGKLHAPARGAWSAAGRESPQQTCLQAQLCEHAARSGGAREER